MNHPRLLLIQITARCAPPPRCLPARLSPDWLPPACVPAQPNPIHAPLPFPSSHHIQTSQRSVAKAASILALVHLYLLIFPQSQLLSITSIFLCLRFSPSSLPRTFFCSAGQDRPLSCTLSLPVSRCETEVKGMEPSFLSISHKKSWQCS